MVSLDDTREMGSFQKLREICWRNFLPISLQVFVLVIAHLGQDTTRPPIRIVNRFQALCEPCAHSLDIHAVRPREDIVRVWFHCRSSGQLRSSRGNLQRARTISPRRRTIPRIQYPPLSIQFGAVND